MGIMYHQIEQLKEEIKDKDSALIKEHFEHHKVQKANEDIKEKLGNAQKRMRNLTNIVETQRTEIKKLESTIQEAEQEKQSQQKEYEGVISERDILGTQLIAEMKSWPCCMKRSRSSRVPCKKVRSSSKKELMR